MAKSGNQCLRKCRARCKTWTALVTRVVIYLSLATYVNLRCVWNWLVEPQGRHCRNPSRGAAFNQTKMKVLVYGLAKTGTTSTVALLNKMYDNVFHLEDFLLHVWAPLADEYWTRKESGGTIWYWDRLSTPSPPAYQGHSFWERREWNTDARFVWPYYEHKAVIAEAVESCHVGGLSFDGFEDLFWPMYERSPEAKVVMLNWRTWDELVRSRNNWDWNKFWLLLAQNMIQCGFHFLPWGALLVPTLDYLTNTSTEVLKRGLDIHARNFDLGFALFRVNIMERRIVQHWFNDLHATVYTEEQFNEFYDEGKRRIPKERLVELNLRKDSPADLCRKLGITDKPICNDTGGIDNLFPLMRPEKENPLMFFKTGGVYLVIHRLNYVFLWGLIYWICGKLRSFVLWITSPLCSRAKGGKSKKKGKTA